MLSLLSLVSCGVLMPGSRQPLPAVCSVHGAARTCLHADKGLEARTAELRSAAQGDSVLACTGVSAVSAVSLSVATCDLLPGAVWDSVIVCAAMAVRVWIALPCSAAICLIARSTSHCARARASRS